MTADNADSRSSDAQDLGCTFQKDVSPSSDLYPAISEFLLKFFNVGVMLKLLS